MEPQKEIVEAVGVLRVSTDKQDFGGDSLSDQLKQIEIARQRVSNQYNFEIKINKIFELTESASTDFEHQPLQKVLTYCKDPRNRIRFAFIKSLDRFTRAGSEVYSRLKVEFAKVGVTFFDCYGILGNGGTINTMEHLGLHYEWSTYAPSFISEILEAERNKSEVRDIQTRMIGAAVRYTRMGYWRGRAPLGFTMSRIETEVGKRLILQPHPVEAKWFEKMYEMRAAGARYQQIVPVVNTMGFRTRIIRRRNKETNEVVALKGQRQLTEKMLSNYISNPIFAGVNNEKWTNKNPVYLKGGGIVSVELFNKANFGKIAIVDENGSPKIYKGKVPDWQLFKLKYNPEYPYKQYVLCPFCHQTLLGSASKGKTGRHFPAYHCSRKHKYYRIKKDNFDKTIMATIKKVKFSKRFIDIFENNFLKNWKIRMEQLNRDNINWEKTIVELREKKHLLIEKIKILTSPASIRAIEAEVEEIEKQIGDASIERSRKEDQEVDIKAILAGARYWMEHFEKLAIYTPDPIKRAAIFGMVFEELPTYQDLLDGTPKLNALFELNRSYQNNKNSSFCELNISNLEPLLKELISKYKFIKDLALPHQLPAFAFT